MEKENNTTEEKRSLNFIEQIIEEDLKEGKNEGRVHTRFPPEPNGYLHIGHATSICLNFRLADQYNGKCNLRFDDTNPEKESMEYVDSIQEDVKWLGFDWEERLFFASDYFEQLYEFAIKLIKDGKAYVDDSTADEIREQRGVPTEPGTESPHRNRPIEENLDLFKRMKAGEFENDKYTLRAKIDMSSPNMHMRDPIMYRIRHHEHYRTGDKWKIYPMYDWTHGLSDAIEGITHSLCTLEFEVHRPLYDWFNYAVYERTDNMPRQIEFARFDLSYTVMSKRRLISLVQESIVDGWDDPRMPSISGFKRRGYTPASIRAFSDRVGITKRKNVTDISILEQSIREDLNEKAQRAMVVLNPLKVVITNYPEGQTEEVDAVNNPNDENSGRRKVPFSREIFIEREDFMEDPPKKFFRLGPDREVRIKYAYFLTCNDFVKDDEGNVTEIHCTYDPESRGGKSPDGRKVKGTLHWVDAAQSINAEIRLYDRLFNDPAPAGHEGKDFTEFINPESLQINSQARLEPMLKNAKPGEKFQFERQGYFCVDSKYSKEGEPVFNRTATLKDTWAKMNK